MVITGNKIPLYSQIAQSLRQRVRTGVYHSGKALPSVRTLSEEFGVSLKVIQKAVYHLQEEGLVATHHGKGVMVLEGKSCDQAAILFGFIHPFSAYMAYESLVLQHAERVFTSKNNFMVSCSSEGDSVTEREMAEHLVVNGVKGIILWPGDNDVNGKYFTELSRRVPVVLVDRQLEGADLPVVQHDSYQAGWDICRHMLEKLNRKRMLVLMDNLNISPYQDFIRGLQDGAGEINRIPDLTVVQLPISDLIGQFGKADFSQVEDFKTHIKRMLTEGGYDSLFCPQQDFLDYVVFETGLYDEFSGLQLGSTCSSGVNIRSRKYCQAGVLDWVIDTPKAIRLAADMLQQWMLLRKVPKPTLPIKFELKAKNEHES